MTYRQPLPKRRANQAKSHMTIQRFRDTSTSTCSGKLSTYYPPDDDEMYKYIEITEYLIMTDRHVDRSTFLHVPIGKKNLTLPMRESKFAHVPPFIIFQNNGTSELPTEITRHLLWWQGKKRTPRIVTSIVRKSGFRTTERSTASWCGTWCNFTAFTKLRHARHFAKVNHFPNSGELGNKISLWRNFCRMKRRYGRRHFDYMPVTFILPEDRYSLKSTMEAKGGFWIVKPPNSCGGAGIKIVSSYCEIPQFCPLVVQRYISWPMLIDGIKFDMRLYVLLTSIDPLRLYLYNEGLVRLATIKYINHVSTLSNRFMHLTNTSVNKVSPNFHANDDLEKCEGNIWSLNCLWKYLAVEEVDTLGIWTRIKEIVVKTIISAEPCLIRSWKKSSMSSYNFHQLFGFDVLLDKHCRPWLLEVNSFPSMMSDTPLCKLVKKQLAKDCLNLVGFHVPDLLSMKELRSLRLVYKRSTVCYNKQLYNSVLTFEDSKKRVDLLRKRSRKSCTKSILKNLTPDDVRVLIRHEDEIARTGRFEMIFPTYDTRRFLDIFENVRYYNLLLDAWENEHRFDRSRGIERLRNLCRRKHHLS